MSRGLGRFQRWILVHTYLKTVKHELPEDWRTPDGYGAAERRWKASPDWLAVQLDTWNNHLMRTEILLNYFDLAKSNRHHPYQAAEQCFLQGPQYKTALAMLARTLMSLHGRYIEWVTWVPGLATRIQQADGCRLTSLGVATAEKLISANR